MRPLCLLVIWLVVKTISGELYNEVSAAYFDGVHSILTGEETAEDALQYLEDDLVDITDFPTGQP